MTSTLRASRRVLLSIWFFGICVAQGNPSENGKPPAGPHPEPLLLTDGRSFIEWKIIGETASALTIRSERTLVKISKTFLTEPMRSAYPLDEDKIADEQRRIEASHLEAADRRARDKARAEDDARAQHARGMEVARQEAAVMARKAAEVAASRDGLLLLKLHTKAGSAVVTMKNVGTGTQSFDWRQLRARSVRGDLRPASSVLTLDTKYGCAIEAGEARSFEVVFGGSMRDGNSLAEVCWFEDLWLKNADEDTSVKALETRNGAM